MFLCEFYEILRTPVLQKQNTSGRLLLSRQLISQKIFIVDVWLDSKYAFDMKCKPMVSIWYEFLQKTTGYWNLDFNSNSSMKYTLFLQTISWNEYV